MKKSISYESPEMEAVEILMDGSAICTSGQNGYLEEGGDLEDMFNI